MLIIDPQKLVDALSNSMYAERAQYQLTLGQLIGALEEANPEAIQEPGGMYLSELRIHWFGT